MWHWKKSEGNPIYWFDRSVFKNNILCHRNKAHWLYNAFSAINYINPGPNLYYNNEYVIPENVSTKEYFDNFTKTLPETATLCFEESSFPREKLRLTPYKRTIKQEKADYIVIGDMVQIIVKDIDYVIFNDTIDVFAILKQYLNADFSGNLNNIYTSKYINNVFKGPLQVMYEGKLKFIIDRKNILKNFNNNLYNKPFILDNDLDRIVNQYLPDPDLTAIKTIYDMINSSDSTTIKLGSTLAAGFNVTKWPLTFTCLFCTSDAWNKPYNGANLALVNQMRSTLNIKGGYGLDSVASIIDASKEKYSEEDIALAQDFVRTLPELKIFCENSQSFYLEGLPFIPDEYKQ